jgi:chemotaxis protein MotB
MKKVLMLIGISGFLASCVPHRVFEETENKLKTCQSDLDNCKKTQQECEKQLSEIKEKMSVMEKENNTLKIDSTLRGSSYRELNMKYQKLSVLNDQLIAKLEKLQAGLEKDNALLSGDLQKTKEDLIRKEAELKLLEQQLLKQKSDLDKLNDELTKREARIKELENILKQKDEAVNQLKKKLQDALFAFENKGLTINIKNGKVYVSMEENLLFDIGKTNVSPKGVEALKSLAKVLEQNPDINIMVEGHTDDIPMKGSGEIKDNWDLSVMRATAVTKIILSNGNIDPKRITAAGRGEFLPLDPSKTPEARKKNRRTEIILTPKLDELFKILDNN